MVVNLDLQALATAGFCSMQYHLRYRHGFPWFPASYEVAVAQSLRDAASHLLLARMGPPSQRKKGVLAAAAMFKRGFELATKLEHVTRTAVTDATTRTNGLLGLTVLDQQAIVHGRDRVVGVDLPYTVEVSEDLKVSGTIDAVYEYMHESTAPATVFLTHMNLDDPLEDLVNWGNLKRGFALRTIADGSRYAMRVRFLEFGAMHGKAPTKFSNPELSAKDSFDALATNVSKLISSGAAVPTMAPEKCAHCPYKSVCSPLLASSQPLVDAAKKKVAEIASKNPFWSKS